MIINGFVIIFFRFFMWNRRTKCILFDKFQLKDAVTVELSIETDHSSPDMLVADRTSKILLCQNEKDCLRKTKKPLGHWEGRTYSVMNQNLLYSKSSTSIIVTLFDHKVNDLWETADGGFLVFPPFLPENE